MQQKYKNIARDATFSPKRSEDQEKSNCTLNSLPEPGQVPDPAPLNANCPIENSSHPITPLEIAIWEHHLANETEPLKKLIRKKRRRLSLLSEKELTEKSFYIYKVLEEEIIAMEDALIAIEAIKIAYIDHTSQLYFNSRSKIKFLEKKWKGSWKTILLLKDIIIHPRKSERHV